MKKTILKMIAVTGLVAGSTFVSNAQVSQGTFMLGGNLGADITMESTTKITGTGDMKTPGYTNWNFSPTFGYFIGDGLALGLSLDINSRFVNRISSNDGKTNENIMSSGLGFSLFVRKYMAITDNVYFHGQASVGYMSGSYTTRKQVGLTALADNNKVSTSNIGLNITPGITYFVAPKWGIDLSLNNIIGYNMTNTKIEGVANPGTAETTGGNFSIGAGLNPTLGLFYYFGN